MIPLRLLMSPVHLDSCVSALFCECLLRFDMDFFLRSHLPLGKSPSVGNVSPAVWHRLYLSMRTSSPSLPVNVDLLTLDPVHGGARDD
ncbi:hypothetical protein EDB81DRAFT_784941 [Dactylonectria macrodidyma]|uniref:Uncharacterized protein n=1 Tax=Dactylonectria macrodidyma TaxID=307937 RepID=A0A9P9FFU7_9HYPO|nr:hypothetical protein EDB81DRAFT_784941 [Dactylonectria macrodidyma]